MKGLPTQPGPAGVMVYFTTPATDEEAFTNTLLMMPVPEAVLPVIVPDTIVEVQLKVVPAVFEAGV